LLSLRFLQKRTAPLYVVDTIAHLSPVL